MKRLQQISTEKTLSVEVKCVLNQHVIDKNFEAIIDCLKELHEANGKLERDLKATTQKSNKLERDIQKLKEGGEGGVSTVRESSQSRNNAKTSKQETEVQLPSKSEAATVQARLQELEQRTKKNNIENLKDINLLLSEMKEVKRRLEELEGKSSPVRTNTERSTDNLLSGQLDIDTTRILQNQLQRHLEMIRKLTNDLDSLGEQNEMLAQKVKPLEGLDKLVADLKSNSSGHTSSTDNMDLSELRRAVAEIQSDRNRLDVLEQRFRMAPTSQEIDDKFAQLRGVLEQLEESVHILQQELTELKNKKGGESGRPETAKPEISKQTQTKVQPVSRKDRQVDQMHESDHRQLKDSMKQLSARMDELELSMKESREKLATSMKDAEQRQHMNTTLNLQKEKMLPNINKRSIKLKQNRESVHNQSREHSNIKELDRKLFDLKGELQQWLRQLLENRTNSKNKDQEQLKDIELKLQELRMVIDRKADQEGVRKYLTFLENKINQLFVVLAPPESEDALIARKGWGCLSCAKKLQKYKGRLGDHINWNNMTTTNYSPPRIGFTQTQMNHKSGGQRNRIASLTDKNNTTFQYDQRHSQQK